MKTIAMPSILSIPVACMIAACSHSASDTAAAAADSAAADTVPAEVTSLIAAVTTGDSAAFAELVNYPLARPYPLHDIEDAAQMRAYYRTLVDDSLRSVVTTHGVQGWSEFGWRGWSLDDGQYLWADDGSILSVPYLSAVESAEKARLSAEEINSLAPSLRGNWQPLRCYRNDDDGTIYRIDTKGDPDTPRPGDFRLAVYAPGTDIHAKPSQLYYGDIDIDGSMLYVTYIFKDGKKRHIIDPNGSIGEYDATFRPDGSDDITLTKAYWLDLNK